MSLDQDIRFMFEDFLNMKFDKFYRPCSHELFGNPYIINGIYNYTVQKHLVDEKIHVRDNEGSINNVSKQSSPGKRNNGGLKIGHMERDSINSSGANHVLISFFGRLSSNIPIYWCPKCGMPGVYFNQNEQYYYCQVCGILKNDQFIKLGYNYSAMLLSHVMNATGIYMRLMVSAN